MNKCQRIEIDFGRMMTQSTMTAHDYLSSAVEAIDKMFGDDYARKHPELIAAYMQTAAIDFAGGCLAQQLRAGLDAIAEGVQGHNTGVGDLDDVAKAIQGLAGEYRNGVEERSADVGKTIRGFTAAYKQREGKKD